MNDAERDDVAAGGPATVVSGSMVSTVHVRVAGVVSALPAASTARTASVCAPSGRPLERNGAEHGAKSPPSSRHS